ncbi:MAG: hypothetical protein NVS2B7_09560 [Herpetosiphon sp.]
MKHVSKMIRWLAPIIAIFALVAFTSGNASAATSKPNKKHDGENRRLERALHHEQLRLQHQAKAFQHVETRVKSVQALIKRLHDHNKPTAAIEQALDRYQAAVRQARSEHEAAADLLRTHAGFSQSGNVIDPAIARDTVKNVRDHLNRATSMLQQANKELAEALKHDHPKGATPSAK